MVLTLKTFSVMASAFMTILLPASTQSFSPTMRPTSPILASSQGSYSSTDPMFQRRPFGVAAAAARRRNDDDEDDRHHRDALALNRAKTDIRNFLTQRAIQSFVFLLNSCRDAATVRWLEQKCEVRNLDSFHGTGAFNLTKYPEWDNILTDLLFTPPDVIVVSTKAKSRGSKNNPYFQDSYVDVEIEIDPPSLVLRIISVRDQIAGEWSADLETLVKANEMILDSYYVTQNEQRVDEAESVLEKKQAQKEAKNDVVPEVKAEDDTTTSNMEDDDDDADDDDDEVRSMTAPYAATSYDERVKVQKKKAYDRTTMIVLGNNIVQDGCVSSPYRKGSFDLLGLLATQESIHRVLREYRESGEARDVSFEWLRAFYVSRVSQYFDGSQEHGRADDFLEELLLTAPLMKEMDGKLGFIDPMRIAEDIIATRSEVAKDWKDIIEKVPTVDHAQLRTIALQLRMGAHFEKSVSLAEKEKAEQIVAEGFQ